METTPFGSSLVVGNTPCDDEGKLFLSNKKSRTWLCGVGGVELFKSMVVFLVFVSIQQKNPRQAQALHKAIKMWTNLFQQPKDML